MPVIDPNGIFDGDRINSCSVMAQLLYPRMLCASNGFGRIQLSYRRIVAVAFPKWSEADIPDEPTLMGHFQEYARNRLLFVYESNRQIWGQWDAKKNTFGKYQTADDKRSPAPPEDAFQKWQEENRQHSIKPSVPMVYFSLSNPPAKIPQGLENVGDGIGVGDGIRYEVLGIGDGKQTSPTPTPTPTEPIEIPADSDVKIKQIADAHPRLIKPAETHRAIVDQLESRLVNLHGSPKKAFQYLLARTLLYRKKTQDWPPGERQFIVGSVNWFKDGCFDEDEALWGWKELGNGAGSTRQTAAAARTARNLEVLVPQGVGPGVSGVHVPDVGAVQPGVVSDGQRPAGRVANSEILAGKPPIVDA